MIMDHLLMLYISVPIFVDCYCFVFEWHSFEAGDRFADKRFISEWSMGKLFMKIVY